ncbi:hypothetical protein RD055328_11000 [Companilactobacillus sp. RD055328]|uniref:GNAT family N-acetyltransferase n=1 Tax=Companilactobacillus sp. RD055328 TaxID=2916634 RepID=UPI001FC87995|nr:GNAT family N-acetyltransferase [Companilactobacillus sp. RD055328]GKQ43177.1 hypothetical protein RD055328_11000 [Companilactobacillus sp. RD055328]
MIKVKLEPLTEDDFQDFSELLKDSEIEQAGIGELSNQQARDFFEQLINDSLHKKLTDNKGTFLGIILINSRGLDESLINTKELGIAIVQKYRNQGIGTMAIKLVSDYAKTVGITELWAATNESNIASQKIFTNNGFEYKYDVDMSMLNLPIQKYYLKPINR